MTYFHKRKSKVLLHIWWITRVEVGLSKGKAAKRKALGKDTVQAILLWAVCHTLTGQLCYELGSTGIQV
jgi:hypothetical protein